MAVIDTEKPIGVAAQLRHFHIGARVQLGPIRVGGDYARTHMYGDIQGNAGQHSFDVVTTTGRLGRKSNGFNIHRPDGSIGAHGRVMTSPGDQTPFAITFNDLRTGRPMGQVVHGPGGAALVVAPGASIIDVR